MVHDCFKVCFRGKYIGIWHHTEIVVRYLDWNGINFFWYRYISFKTYYPFSVAQNSTQFLILPLVLKFFALLELYFGHFGLLVCMFNYYRRNLSLSRIQQLSVLGLHDKTLMCFLSSIACLNCSFTYNKVRTHHTVQNHIILYTPTHNKRVYLWKGHDLEVPHNHHNWVLHEQHRSKVTITEFISREIYKLVIRIWWNACLQIFQC